MGLSHEISKCITNGHININQEHWNLLNEKYDKEDIKECLSNEILSGNILLPLKILTYKDAEDSFKNLLSYKCNDIKEGNLVTRYDYSFDNIGYGRYIDESNVGNVASDFFQQHNRYMCGSINSPSPVRTWSNKKFLNGLLNSIWTLKCKSVDDTVLRTCLALRKYVASQFKPSVAKSIYEKLNSVDIMDFSAGWGDRLCGFYACENTKSYIGIDPNTSVFNKYYEQVEFYSNYAQNKSTRFINSPAEDIIDIPKEIVDTVFTSPPYFNIEKYTNNSNQSYIRYRKLDDWLSKFLFKAIDLSVNALRENGYLAINISDVYSNHQVNHICDPMNYYIKNLGLHYEGVIGMKMAKRPNSNAAKDGIFIEPIWLWRK